MSVLRPCYLYSRNPILTSDFLYWNLSRWTYKVCEVWDFRQRLVDCELEGDVGEQEDEGELQAVLGFTHVYRERSEDKRTDEDLQQQRNQQLQ